MKLSQVLLDGAEIRGELELFAIAFGSAIAILVLAAFVEHFAYTKVGRRVLLNLWTVPLAMVVTFVAVAVVVWRTFVAS